jgi:aspartyl-tRNA(Asn)/glutamyl-tRNA(Gln) amidotransferase subunit A
MTPAATGTDTAGSLRIPSAMCGTSAVKPTYGTVPLRGIVPLGPTLDHAGPMARTVLDCEPLLAAMAGIRPPRERRPLSRYAVSPRLVHLDPDVVESFEAVCGLLGARELPAPAFDDPGAAFLDVTCTGMLVYHRRFDDRRDEYRPSIRGFLEYAEERAITGEQYVAIQERRAAGRDAWLDWFDEHGVDAIVEPTVPIVAHARGSGYDEAFTDYDEISLTHQWNWTGFPVVTLPSGAGRRSGLPTSVSLVGPPGSDWDLIAAGAALQAELGTVSP